jgi:hypothetical protein
MSELNGDETSGVLKRIHVVTKKNEEEHAEMK